MADYSDALGGKGLHFRLKSLDVRLSKQFVRYNLGITDVKVLLAPVPNFSSGNLPLRSAETNGGRTGFAFENDVPSRENLRRCLEVRTVRHKQEGRVQCRKHRDLAADHHRVRLRAPSGKDLPLSEFPPRGGEVLFPEGKQ